MKKFSIITATFNSEKTIRRCLESVSNQDLSNFEHIIVDGLSGDATLKIIHEFKHNIKIISEKDLGIYDAWSKGVKSANGKYIMFLNSDDCLSDNFILRNIAKEIQNNPGYDCYSGYVRAFDTQSNYEYRSERSIDWKSTLFFMNYCILGSVFSSNVFQRFGTFNTNYRISGDFDFMSRLVLSRNFFYIKIPLDVQIMFLGGISHAHKNLGRQEVKKIVNGLPSKKAKLWLNVGTGYQALLSASFFVLRYFRLIGFYRKFRDVLQCQK